MKDLLKARKDFLANEKAKKEAENEKRRKEAEQLINMLIDDILKQEDMIDEQIITKGEYKRGIVINDHINVRIIEERLKDIRKRYLDKNAFLDITVTNRSQGSQQVGIRFYV